MTQADTPIGQVDRSGALVRYYKELLAFFSNSLRDRDAATDVVHESYARVLAMDAQISIPEPRALLYCIGKNIVLDASRRNKVESGALESLTSLGHDAAPSVEREVVARQELAHIVSRLVAMPRKRRDAFVLVKIYGYSHAEAASHLACTVMAIEKHVARGIMDFVSHARLQGARNHA
ncbi:sigma factor-like helix-turn-helix DNA-binding protein [Bordetella sp. LUAb4]|uniref:sigma factor-like helix-turn-helix DNA-binding protein n=1 Tax=Bordetella sp. LUAb4 TaxID=2843195 RepID=UPI001E2A6FA9|nr:sigma factor-like helix-turn-helix DNA-binding protein [Bordetella sp. LUAb4]